MPKSDPPKPDPNPKHYPALVKCLESLLSRAKSGEIVGVAFAVQYSSGKAESLAETGGADIAKLAMALEMMKLRLITRDGG